MKMRLIINEDQARELVLAEMTSSEVDVEARNTNTSPTDGQKSAGNYKKAHVRVKGLPIAIENPKGSIRRGRNKDGTEWSIEMKNHYGYFNLTDGDGKDGDAIDVFLGPDIDDFDNVYVVDQKNEKGDFDESKVMLGFTSKEQARLAYMSNYQVGWDGFMGITGVPFKFFKKWLYDKMRQRKPFKDYVDVVKKKIDEQRQLTESSINRVLDWMNQYDIACITAYRNEFKNATEKTLDDRPQELKDIDEKRKIENPKDKTPYKYTTSEKKLRNKDLKATLLGFGYGVTNIHGNYIENYGTIDAVELGESSFFVVNLPDDPNFKENLFKLSEYYNQDCFLYKAKGDKVAYNIGTNNGDYPGYGNVDNIGELHINIDNEFLSRVGNKSFSFTTDENPKQDKVDYNFHTRKVDRKEMLREMLGLDVYQNYSRGARMSIRGIQKRTLQQIQ